MQRIRKCSCQCVCECVFDAGVALFRFLCESHLFFTSVVLVAAADAAAVGRMEHKESIYVNLIRAHFECDGTEREIAPSFEEMNRERRWSTNQSIEMMLLLLPLPLLLLLLLLLKMVHFIWFGFYLCASLLLLVLFR